MSPLSRKQQLVEQRDGSAFRIVSSPIYAKLLPKQAKKPADVGSDRCGIGSAKGVRLYLQSCDSDAVTLTPAAADIATMSAYPQTDLRVMACCRGFDSENNDGYRDGQLTVCLSVQNVTVFLSKKCKRDRLGQ